MRKIGLARGDPDLPTGLEKQTKQKKTTLSQFSSLPTQAIVKRKTVSECKCKYKC